MTARLGAPRRLFAISRRFAASYSALCEILEDRRLALDNSGPPTTRSDPLTREEIKEIAARATEKVLRSESDHSFISLT
jgi:hypothetical protein